MIDAPELVRRIIEAMTTQAVGRCEREGIDLADFYASMLKVQGEQPKVSVTELFDLTFERLATRSN